MNDQMTGRTQTSEYSVTYVPQKLCLRKKKKKKGPKKHMACRLSSRGWKSKSSLGQWCFRSGAEETQVRLKTSKPQQGHSEEHCQLEAAGGRNKGTNGTGPGTQRIMISRLTKSKGKGREVSSQHSST